MESVSAKTFHLYYVKHFNSTKLQKVGYEFFKHGGPSFTLPVWVVLWSDWVWNVQPVMWILCRVRRLQRGGVSPSTLTLAGWSRFSLQGPRQATNSWGQATLALQVFLHPQLEQRGNTRKTLITEIQHGKNAEPAKPPFHWNVVRRLHWAFGLEINPNLLLLLVSQYG